MLPRPRPQRRRRVATIGSVRVADQMVIERYSHVMHIVSNVEGTLRPGLSSVDVLRAAFPRNRQRRAQGARDADHRRARAVQARHLFRRRPAT
jgi:hypothetical protein